MSWLMRVVVSIPEIRPSTLMLMVCRSSWWTVLVGV
jgi:hypothetical protein